MTTINVSGTEINHERIGDFLLLHYKNEFNTFEIEVLGKFGNQIYYRQYSTHFESSLVYDGIKAIASNSYEKT